MSGFSIGTGFAWIEEQLRGSAQLMADASNRIARDILARSEQSGEIAVPLISIHHRFGSPVAVVGDEIIREHHDFMVKVVNISSDFARTNRMVIEMDAILHQAAGPIDGSDVLRCWRTRSVHDPETFQGVKYDHIGGFYRLTIV